MALTKVQNTGIADDAVTTDKIENSTVIAADIAPGTITNAKLSNSSITLNSSAVSLGGSATLKHIDWQSLVVADGSTQLTAVAGRGYFLDTNTGVIEVLLPSSPSRGDTFVFVDYGGTFATNKIIINTGGQLIDSTSGPDFKVTTNNAVVELVYVDANKGYLVKLNQAAGTTPEAIVTGNYDQKFIVATGGTVTESGDFKIHTFTGDGDFIVTAAGLGTSEAPSIIDYLVVAGGGSGGSNPGNASGGGGAGGFRESLASCSPTHTPSGHTASPLKATTGITITAGTFPISVGAGGAPVSSGTPGVSGNSGSNSVFSTITSAGGGFGGTGSGAGVSGANGGSGGGAGGGSRERAGGVGNTPPVSPAQGTNGGASTPPSIPTDNQGGGGGGATEAGTTAGPANGPGGDGATTHITGSPVAYAGGGGSAASGPNPSGGDGGTGGGGAGGNGGSAGTANTGGGGGGAGPATPKVSGAGGKGIVVLKYKFQ